MQNDFNFCPNCGGKNIKNVNMRKWACPDCNYSLYNNIAAAIGLIIKMPSGKILFEKRAKEPRKGFLALPGGFVDPNETAEDACFRECIEEIGVKPTSIKFIATFPNTYEYKNILYKTCDIFFEATLPQNAELKIQESEVLALEERFVRNQKDIEEIPLAFESAKKTLLKYIESK